MSVYDNNWPRNVLLNQTLLETDFSEFEWKEDQIMTTLMKGQYIEKIRQIRDIEE
jgi:hypothetical protein